MVAFQSGAQVQVTGGILQVVGTVSQPVTFSSIDGTQRSGNGLLFRGTKLQKVVLQYASFSNLNSSIYDTDADNILGTYSRSYNPSLPLRNTGTLSVSFCNFTNTALTVVQGTLQGASIVNSNTTFLPYCNNAAAGSVTIAVTTDTLTWLPAKTTGTRTLAVGSIATVYKNTATSWRIWGFGLT